MSKTEVRFLDGFDSVRSWPKYAKMAGLDHRFAVIQETYKPDCADMYFDEQLWLSLLAFAQKAAARTRIALKQDGSEEVAAEVFLGRWRDVPKEDRMPPPFIFGWKDEELKLAIETEYWCNSGGPRP